MRHGGLDGVPKGRVSRVLPRMSASRKPSIRTASGAELWLGVIPDYAKGRGAVPTDATTLLQRGLRLTPAENFANCSSVRGAWRSLGVANRSQRLPLHDPPNSASGKKKKVSGGTG